ncbi:hypothetical protein CBER1_08146 [Cercospora berteroae]|uniref:Major facilitator superfamily (MFS) profile domain-containing protein n=1 Tax=Cercospora berteroae TaxID=357750 RepID=A0A2S6CLG6_9PEZI|nr:hypothetical protein CBER1_08146 [Cercospora berteroae]
MLHAKPGYVKEKEISNGSTPSAESFPLKPLGQSPLDGPDGDKSEAERAALDKHVLRKVDAWIMPWFCLMYLLCFLDRTNIGNARLTGMEKDLGMEGRDYNTALTVFFIAYAGAEPFTNLLMKKVGPRLFFTSIVISWGLCMMCTGFVTSYHGLLAARWFLGITEAGLYPGVQYYLSCWYKRSELGVRLATFFAMAALAGSFGGLLAAAIANMHGIGGKPGWAWIFILEGLATIVAGIFCWWMVFDWPATARFLTQDERLRVRYRLASDNQAGSGEQFDRRHIYAALRDWKTWAHSLLNMGTFMPLYAFSLFLPTIVAGMGYEGTHAQLLTVPPYALAACVTVFIGWLADRTKQRGFCTLGISCLAVAGFSMLLASGKPHVQYAATFLGAMGIYPALPNNITWAANNTEGTYKRGVLIGIIVGMGNINGIVSCNIYMKSEKPRYRTGHAVIIAYVVICELVVASLTRAKLARENKRRKSGERDNMLDGMTADQIIVQGDKRPDFIYTL